MSLRSKFVILSMLSLSACGIESASDLKIIGGQKEPSNYQAKGSYQSTIGFNGVGGSGASYCTGSRISKSTYITAAHCLINARDGEMVNIYASNARKFTAYLKNIQIHPSYSRPTVSNVGSGSDIALFELSYRLREEKVVWDGFVDAVPIAFGTFPKKDLPVVLAGFGCEQKTGIGWTDKCDQSPLFQYMKSARNKIYKEPLSLLNNLERFFELDASTNKDGITGFTSSGDSGGPVLTGDGKLLGITRSSNVLFYTENDGWFGTTTYTWLEYPDVKQWILSAISSEKTSESYQDADRVTIELANGDRYFGSIRNGFRSGEGTMYYRDGKVYKGNWLMNARSGYGDQSWPETSKYLSYKGNWANDLPNGQGTLNYRDGLSYTGLLVDARLDGVGTMTYQNGDKRTGRFVKDKREGEFILETTDGRRWRELFEGDVRVSIEELK